MKKILIVIASMLFTAGIASAQSLEEATELYNTGATMLNGGDNSSALMYFEQSLQMGEALGEEAAELISNCKDIIPKIYLAVAKDYAAAKDSDNAIASINKTIEIAGQYGATETLNEAKELLPQVLLQNAGNLLNSKQYEAAAEAYGKVTEIDPENGIAWLRMGMSYGACGKLDEAIEAYNKAAQFGQDKNANKQIANIYLKKAIASQKAKDMAGVLENAELSASYLNTPNAQKLIGSAASTLKQNDKAVAAFLNYLEINPNANDKNQIYYQLATVYQEMGNKDQACAYFKLVANDPQFGEYSNYVIKSVLKCE